MQAAPRHNTTRSLSLSNRFGLLQQLNDEGSGSFPGSSTFPCCGKKKSSQSITSAEEFLPAIAGSQHHLGTEGETISTSAAANRSCLVPSKAAKKNAARSKRRAAARLNKAQAVVHEGSVDLGTGADETQGSNNGSTDPDAAAEERLADAGLEAAQQHQHQAAPAGGDGETADQDDGFKVVQSKRRPVADGKTEDSSSPQWPLGVPHRDLIMEVLSQQSSSAIPSDASYGYQVVKDESRVPQHWREADKGAQ